jgi:hypothetical protein
MEEEILTSAIEHPVERVLVGSDLLLNNVD